jgi:pyridine nucleotide-disulfide oxidoreductase
MVSGSDPSVVIVGAGPYGLSIAAHLKYHGVDFRIFGTPMHRWQAQMPAGMFLKSEPFASNLEGPGRGYTLQDFCGEAGLPYGSSPVSLETFTRYALCFQRRFVSTVEDVSVTALNRRNDRFELRLASGEKVRTSKVVLATGLAHAASVPSELANLPTELVSHSSEHRHLSRFTGQHVVVIGGGQSALETAALLNEVQANVCLLVRRLSIAWNPRPLPEPRSLWQRLRRPATPLGPGLQHYLFNKSPMSFYHLPEAIRLNRVRRTLGPAGAWWLYERVVDRLPIMLGHSVHKAEALAGKLLLHVRGPNGNSHKVTADHAIAATGYRFAVQSLPFFSEGLLSHLHRVHDAPWISPNFESSIPGLYFTGLASAYHFGPEMRFLCGAQTTARRISAHIAKRYSPVRVAVIPAFSLGP